MTTIDRPVGLERRNEVGKGLLGASIGFAVAGPIGAAIGGFVGAKLGISDDNERKAEASKPVLTSFALYEYLPSEDDLGQQYFSSTNPDIFKEVIEKAISSCSTEELETIMVFTKWSDEEIEFTKLSQIAG